jgi:hypothetical protein
MVVSQIGAGVVTVQRNESGDKERIDSKAKQRKIVRGDKCLAQLAEK